MLASALGSLPSGQPSARCAGVTGLARRGGKWSRGQNLSGAIGGSGRVTVWLRLALLGALLAAFALRVVAFGELPPGLHADEAVDGLDAASGILAPFFPATHGREEMVVLFLGPALAVLGREPSALRLPMAFVGVLTVVATFALGAAALPAATRGRLDCSRRSRAGGGLALSGSAEPFWNTGQPVAAGPGAGSVAVLAGLAGRRAAGVGYGRGSPERQASTSTPVRGWRRSCWWATPRS
ncbi:MAG: hypothetical protein KatS3mg061_0923 [Dehalococcoidia bacterium]|nr:MAG: hypothetical protein KatS3mg061_0923 [Dehalococcoidia bacterium]